MVVNKRVETANERENKRLDRLVESSSDTEKLKACILQLVSMVRKKEMYWLTFGGGGIPGQLACEIRYEADEIIESLERGK